MLVIVAPGQGSQTPGFLNPWLELEGSRERLEAFSAAAEMDLVAHGTVSGADTIKDTAVAQPLIVAAGLLAAGALLPEGDTSAIGAISGHSVGEVTAAAIAGVISERQAVELVRERGKAMAAAAALTPTGMSAVLGGDPTEVLQSLERHGLTPANMNAAGQIVAAGTTEQLAALAADPPTRARVIPLAVAGAFHTHHMEPAVAALRAHTESLTPSDPRITLISNADGGPVTDGTDVVRRLVSQVSNPVRWDRCSETFAELGVTALIELAPAGTLVGLAKRALKGIELLAVKTPEDLDAAQRLLRDHGASAAAAASPSSKGHP